MQYFIVNPCGNAAQDIDGQSLSPGLFHSP